MCKLFYMPQDSLLGPILVPLMNFKKKKAVIYKYNYEYWLIRMCSSNSSISLKVMYKGILTSYRVNGNFLEVEVLNFFT